MMTGAGRLGPKLGYELSPLLASMAHVVRRHRRPLAALVAALAVLAALSTLSRPSAELAWAVVTTRPVAAGAVLEAADLASVRLPVAALPEPRVGIPVKSLDGW